MRSRVESAERLLVLLESAPGSGHFELDERLRVEEVWQRCDGNISRASMAVRLDDAFDAEEARRRYHPACRLAIATQTAPREWLFEGYIPAQTWRWDGRSGKQGEEYVVSAEHVLGRLTRAPEALVYGRRVRTAAIEDGLRSFPEQYAGASELSTALACVFNPDGIGNCAELPLLVASVGEAPRPVPIFTWDGDPRARRWTYAAILRYLAWFHLPRCGPVGPGNIFAVTDGITASGVSPGGALAAALAREAVSLACEGVNMVEALGLLAAAAGVHFSAETSGDAAGQPVTALRVWAAGDGRCRELFLARGGKYDDGQPRYRTRGRSAAAILSDNNTYRGEVAWAGAAGAVEVVVLGGVKQYEMTVPLWPGWIPEDGLDNVPPEQREASKAAALTPAMVQALGEEAQQITWLRRYVRAGDQFALFSDVGRLWVLNEDGRHYPELYNRNPPFDDYRPFDFSTVVPGGAGDWMRRTRRLLPLITRSQRGRRLGTWLEISFDGGASWQQQAGGVKLLEDRVGVYFDCENLTEITPTGVDPGVMNLWYAIIDQTFRVRVTGVIESDQRLTGKWSDVGGGDAVQVDARLVRRPAAFRFASREQITNVLAELGTSADERDDSAAITALARTLAISSRGRRVKALPAIPWIETGYCIGDRITEVRGRQVPLSTGGAEGWPAVLERRFLLCDGCYETVLSVCTERWD